MKLLAYLVEKFPKFDYQEVKDHFLTEFGVDVKKYENKYMFKYDTILADYSKDITHECRGSIIYYDKGNYRVYSRPFDKFFNREEGKHEWCKDSYIEENLHKIRLMEKKDGSCIQVYYDFENEMFRASTLGSIQTESVFDEPYTFSDLFWRLFNNAFQLNPAVTFLFEMWSKSNQVVTNYDSEHLTLLAVRHMDGRYVPKKDIDLLVKDTHIRLPVFVDRVFKNAEEIKNFVESESTNEDVYGSVPEGFVAYDIELNKPVFKEKNLKYCQYHRINLGDRRFVTKNMAAALFEGNIDDMYGDLTDVNKEFIDRLRLEIIKEQSIINEFSKTLFKCESKKDFAILMNKTIPNEIKDYTGMFFSSFELVTVKNEPPSLVDWMRDDKRYNRFMDKWKMV